MVKMRSMGKLGTASTLKPSGLMPVPRASASLEMAKKPDIGSEALVSGSASRVAA